MRKDNDDDNCYCLHCEMMMQVYALVSHKLKGVQYTNKLSHCPYIVVSQGDRVWFASTR